MKAKLITADGAFRWLDIPTSYRHPTRRVWPDIVRVPIFKPLRAFSSREALPAVSMSNVRIRSYRFENFDEQDGHTLIYREVVE